MKIAIDVRNIGRGRTGSEVVVRELVYALLKIDKKNEYFLLTDTDEKEIIDYINAVLELHKFENASLYSIMSYGRADWVLYSCPRFVRKYDIDVFHTEYIVPFFLPKKTYVITHIHDVSFKVVRDKIQKKDLFFLDTLIPRSLKRADKIIAVSNFTKDEILKYYPCARGKVSVVHNACSSFFKKLPTDEDRLRVKEKYNIPDEFVLSIGSMQPRKNIPFLIEAFSQITDRLPNVKLVLTGRKNEKFDSLISEILEKNPNLEEKVIFTGFVEDDDLPALYTLSKLFVFPSLYEGFSLPILEAMTLGVPCAVSDIKIHHEVAEDAVIYFYPNDIDQCAEMMYHAYTCVQTRNDLISRSQVQSKIYSWNKAAAIFLDIVSSSNMSKHYMKKTAKYFNKKSTDKNVKKKNKKKIFIIIAIILIPLLLIVGYFFFRTSNTVGKVSKKGGIFSSIAKTISLKENYLKGEGEGRINIALLGMRGKGVVGGGELADTIMIASFIKDKNNPDGKFNVSLMSVPRDLFVTTPDGRKAKINAVYAEGARKGKGMEYMKKMLEEVVGQPIQYAITVNFKAFSDVVDAIGGVEITRETEFIEPLQFYDTSVCDGDKGGVFTVPIPDKFDRKYKKNGKIAAKYPICLNKNAECGGVFKVPAGTTNLNGAQALCYVRSRKTSSDFDRARRQQEVIGKIREKATNIGTLSSLSNINKLLDAVGDNVQTDLEPWEMQRLFDLYTNKMADKKVKAHKVLENSKEGLLYAPPKNGYGYTLLPRGNNYDKIHEAFKNILN